MRLEVEENRLSRLSVLSNRNAFYEKLERGIEESRNKIIQLFSDKLNESEFQIRSAAERLNALSPLAVLGRGYSITVKDNKVIKSVNDINSGENINIRLYDGTLSAAVTEVNKNE